MNKELEQIAEKCIPHRKDDCLQTRIRTRQHRQMMVKMVEDYVRANIDSLHQAYHPELAGPHVQPADARTEGC